MVPGEGEEESEGEEVKDAKTLRKMVKRSTEKGLAKLALACVSGRGVRLSRDEVCDIYDMDNALHTRLQNEFDAMVEKGAKKK